MEKNIGKEKGCNFISLKKWLPVGFVIAIIIGCTTTKTPMNTSSDAIAVAKNDTVRIANDSLEYEIIITDPGFSSWLISGARPRGFYSQDYLERKNLFWVAEYNRRVLDPFRYGDLYVMRIDYDSRTNYGYEVNYLLFNYFVFFQKVYRQKL
jgi:hypothetical protein